MNRKQSEEFVKNKLVKLKTLQTALDEALKYLQQMKKDELVVFDEWVETAQPLAEAKRQLDITITSNNIILKHLTKEDRGS